jgi:hypothetical protein
VSNLKFHYSIYRSAFDQDEMEEEQRERMHKRKWNETFRKFTQSVENVVENFSFDSPFDDLAFNGCVERSLSLSLSLLYLPFLPKFLFVTFEFFVIKYLLLGVT